MADVTRLDELRSEAEAAIAQARDAATLEELRVRYLGRKSELTTVLRGLENDVYFQVGLLTTIGLSAKNAILIVEFAKELYEQGKGLTESVVEAARLRLRPILMTSLAFIFGVLPMAISHGAGSGSQHAVGTGVMGGMITATLLAIFFVPLFFVLVRRRFPGRKTHPVPQDAGNR